MMKERPILFNALMVRAILDDRKAMTRRVVKPQPEAVELGKPCWKAKSGIHTYKTIYPFDCPYGQACDRLWVRETWATDAKNMDDARAKTEDVYGPGAVYYRASEAHPYEIGLFWRSAIFMPRWACRIVLEITDVRVERLQDISEEGADDEGADFATDGLIGNTFRERFKYLWDIINGKKFSWQSNPWVWVIQFRRIHV
jgi:hypothetical protein